MTITNCKVKTIDGLADHLSFDAYLKKGSFSLVLLAYLYERNIIQKIKLIEKTISGIAGYATEGFDGLKIYLNYDTLDTASQVFISKFSVKEINTLKNIFNTKYVTDLDITLSLIKIAKFGKISSVDLEKFIVKYNSVVGKKELSKEDLACLRQMLSVSLYL